MKKEIKILLEDKKEELKRQMSDISCAFCGDYSDITRDNYICDAITECADGQVDIYTSDLLEWAKSNYEYVEQAIDDFGVAKNSNGRADFVQTIVSGQFIKNEEELNRDIEEIVELLIINYLLEQDIEIEEETIEELLDDVKYTINSANYFSDILDKINEYTNKDEE